MIPSTSTTPSNPQYTSMITTVAHSMNAIVTVQSFPGCDIRKMCSKESFLWNLAFWVSDWTSDIIWGGVRDGINARDSLCHTNVDGESLDNPTSDEKCQDGQRSHTPYFMVVFFIKINWWYRENTTVILSYFNWSWTIHQYIALRSWLTLVLTRGTGYTNCNP